MSWRCLICGVRFDEPVVRVYRENLDGENGIETRTVAECRYCGEEWFTEVEDDAESG